MVALHCWEAIDMLHPLVGRRVFVCAAFCITYWIDSTGIS